MREAKRRVIFDVHALRDEEDGGCRRNFNSRVLNNAYQNPSSRVPSLSNGELVVSSNLLSLSLFLPSFLPPPYRPPSTPLVLAIGSFYHAPKARCSPPLYPHPFYRGLAGKIWRQVSFVSGRSVVVSLAYFSVRPPFWCLPPPYFVHGVFRLFLVLFFLLHHSSHEIFLICRYQKYCRSFALFFSLFLLSPMRPVFANSHSLNEQKRTKAERTNISPFSFSGRKGKEEDRETGFFLFRFLHSGRRESERDRDRA